jgi:hypothetical protein
MCSLQRELLSVFCLQCVLLLQCVLVLELTRMCSLTECVLLLDCILLRESVFLIKFLQRVLSGSLLWKALIYIYAQYIYIHFTTTVRGPTVQRAARAV